MGEVASKVFHNYSNGFGPENTKPQHKDWITTHARLTKLSVVEVERLWHRFRQLGCDEDGIIHKQSLTKSPTLKGDLLTTNLLLAMALDGESIYFHTFLNSVRWVSTASTDEKSKAIFLFFNNGNAVGKDLFTKILRRVYADKDVGIVESYVETLLDAITSKAASPQQVVTYEGYLRVCHTLPTQHLSNILDFSIIPAGVGIDSPSLQPHSRRDERERGEKERDLRDEALLSDESIDELSSALATSDWSPIMVSLGLSPSQIERTHSKYRDDTSKIKSLLKAWRALQEDEATCAALKLTLGSWRPQLVHLVYGMASGW